MDRPSQFSRGYIWKYQKEDRGPSHTYGEYVSGWRQTAFPDYPYLVNDQGEIRYKDEIFDPPTHSLVMKHENLADLSISPGELILGSFFPKPSPVHVCKHVNGNRKQNHLDNLYWWAKTIKRKRKKTIDQLSLEGEYLQTFSSMKEASKELFPGGKRATLIYEVLRGSTTQEVMFGRKETAYGFMWRYSPQ